MVPGQLPKSIPAVGITSVVCKLFLTHPPIEERIAALQNNAPSFCRRQTKARLGGIRFLGVFIFPASHFEK